MMGFGSYVAGAAEVSVEGDKIKIHRIIGATDPGYAVNPAQIDRQVAGSFVYGPRGIPHTFVVSSEEARSLLVTEPGGFECFVRALSVPAETPTLPPASVQPPAPEVMMATAVEYGLEILGPPGIPA